ncbi:hypothetical protein BHM03_00060766 [Ensete ventricosum]|nr:hypothetical protein BHM03_00060766 [Ensete ventricosum]
MSTPTRGRSLVGETRFAALGPPFRPSMSQLVPPQYRTSPAAGATAAFSPSSGLKKKSTRGANDGSGKLVRLRCFERATGQGLTLPFNSSVGWDRAVQPITVSHRIVDDSAETGDCRQSGKDAYHDQGSKHGPTLPRHRILTRGLEILFGCVVRGREETNKLEGDHRSKKLSSMTLGGSGGSGIVGEASLPLPSFSITFLLT